MKIRQFLGMSCAVSLLGSSVQAATPTNVDDVRAQIAADSTLLSGWLSDQFKLAAPYNSTSGNIVPSQLKIFGFEVGVNAVVSNSKPDNDGLHALPTQLVNTHEIDSPDNLPFPMILGHAKFGLPLGMDAGVRIGGIPSTDRDEGDTHMEVTNKVFGLDLRKNFIEEGITRPFGLTLGLNYTHAKGHIMVRSPYESIDPQVTLDGAVGTGRTDWDTDSVGVQAILNKKIAFVNPYIGASVNKNFGDVDSSIITTGNVTEIGGNPIAPQSIDTTGTGHANADSVDVRGLAGVEFSLLPFIRLGLGIEVASQHQATGNLGLRVQFR
jgi:hypothetical protein